MADEKPSIINDGTYLLPLFKPYSLTTLPYREEPFGYWSQRYKGQFKETDMYYLPS